MAEAAGTGQGVGDRHDITAVESEKAAGQRHRAASERTGGAIRSELEDAVADRRGARVGVVRGQHGDPATQLVEGAVAGDQGCQNNAVGLVEVDRSRAGAKDDAVGRDDGAAEVVRAETADVDRAGRAGLSGDMQRVGHRQRGAAINNEVAGVGAADREVARHPGTGQLGRAAVVDEGIREVTRHDLVRPVERVGPTPAVGDPVVTDETVVIEEQAAVRAGQEEIPQTETVGDAAGRPGKGEVGTRGHAASLHDRPGVGIPLRPEIVTGIDKRAEVERQRPAVGQKQIAGESERRGEIGARAGGGIGGEAPEVGRVCSVEGEIPADGEPRARSGSERAAKHGDSARPQGVGTRGDESAALADERTAGVGVRGGHGEHPASGQDHLRVAGKLPCVGTGRGVGGLVEDHRGACETDDVTLHGRCISAQRALTQRGAAGKGVAAGQGERAGAILGQTAASTDRTREDAVAHLLEEQHAPVGDVPLQVGRGAGQRAGQDCRPAGVGVRPGERERAGSVLDQGTAAADHAGVAARGVLAEEHG